MKLRISPYVAGKIHRTKDQFKLQTFRAGGKGGQHQNKTESGVRIVDTVTGISAECREERDQPTNRKRAFTKLVQRLVEHYQQEEAETAINLATNSSHGPYVRTYHEKGDLTIDHRLPGVSFSTSSVLDGRLEPVISKLLTKSHEEEMCTSQ